MMRVVCGQPGPGPLTKRAQAFAFASGGTSFNPALPQQALFKFDLGAIPAGATIVSAGFIVNQTNNGVVTGNLHRVTAPWNELTVTWNSFGAAYDPAIFKTFSTAGSSVVFNVAPQLTEAVKARKG